MNLLTRLPLFRFVCLACIATHAHDRCTASDHLPPSTRLEFGDLHMSIADLLTGDDFVSSDRKPPTGKTGATRLNKQSTVFSDVWRTAEPDSPIRITFTVSSRYETSSALTRLARQVTAELGKPDAQKQIGKRDFLNPNNKQVFKWSRLVEHDQHLTLSIREDPNTVVIECRTIANW